MKEEKKVKQTTDYFGDLLKERENKNNNNVEIKEIIKEVEVIKEVVKEVPAENSLCKLQEMKELLKIDKNIFGSLTTDNEIINFLEAKTFEMTKLKTSGTLYFGKILSEVAKELGKKGSPDGLYTRFLEINGFKKDSALQHRKKYELWENAKSDRTKQIIALLSLKDCEKLYKVPELLIDIEENKTITLEEVKNLLSPSKQITEKIENEIEEFDFNIMLSFQEKFEKLEENKKQEVTKLLLKIEKIMGSN